MPKLLPLAQNLLHYQIWWIYLKLCTAELLRLENFHSHGVFDFEINLDFKKVNSKIWRRCRTSVSAEFPDNRTRNVRVNERTNQPTNSRDHNISSPIAKVISAGCSPVSSNH